MLSINNINYILEKLDMIDTEYDLESADNSGDYIRVLLVDTEFRSLKANLLNSKILNTGIKDISPKHIILELKGQFEGFNYYYKVKIEAISGNTRITLATKRVDFVTEDGDLKHLLTFEMLKNYKETFI